MTQLWFPKPRIVCERSIRYYYSDEELNKIRCNTLKIGENCFIERSAHLDHAGGIEIGDNVYINGQCSILTHDMARVVAGLEGLRKPVKIGSRVFVGIKSTILMGITIGDDVIIGCNSVVTKNIPSGSVWAGNPAVYISSLKEYRDKNKKDYA